MLIISAQAGSGINALFPLFISNRERTISAVEWKRYRKLAPVFLVVNVAYCLLLAGLLIVQDSDQRDSYFSITVPVLFVYTFCRVKLLQKRIKLQVSKSMKKDVAPPIVWAEYFSFGLALVLVQSVSLSLDSDPGMQMFLIALQVFFALYAMLPVLNYLGYRRQLYLSR
jgi:hypothetical protein